MEFTSTARFCGIVSAVCVFILQIAYAITLAIGFALLENQDQPIADPMFTIMELLIIAMMPPMVLLMVSIHAWAAPARKVLTGTSVLFMASLSLITCSLHFVILTLSRQSSFDAYESLPLFLSFEWPSVAYALDIIAWDFFFALSMLFAAPALQGSVLAKAICVLMVLSGALAFAGMLGVVYADMTIRNIGIVGYLGVFMIVAALVAVLFVQTSPIDASTQSFR